MQKKISTKNINWMTDVQVTTTGNISYPHIPQQWFSLCIFPLKPAYSLIE